MPRHTKLEKKAKCGTLITHFAQAGNVVLVRSVKTTGRTDTSYQFANSTESRTQYHKLIAQARAAGFVSAPTRKSRKSPTRRRKTTV